MANRNYVIVWAVVRYDAYMTEDDLKVTIKAILPTREEAEAEVVRLRQLNTAAESHYVYCSTKYYPDGRNVEIGY